MQFWPWVGFVVEIALFLLAVVLAVRAHVRDERSWAELTQARLTKDGDGVAPPPQGTTPIIAGVAIALLAGIFFFANQINRSPNAVPFWTPSCGSPILNAPKEAFTGESLRVYITNIAHATCKADMTLTVNGNQQSNPMKPDPIRVTNESDPIVETRSAWLSNVAAGTQSVQVAVAGKPEYGASSDITVKKKQQLSDIANSMQGVLTAFTVVVGVIISALGYFRRQPSP